MNDSGNDYVCNNNLTIKKQKYCNNGCDDNNNNFIDRIF